MDVDAWTMELEIGVVPNTGSYEWVAAIDEYDGYGYGNKIIYIADYPTQNYWTYSNMFVLKNTMLGDLNSDGEINIIDIVALVNIVAFNQDYNELGDMNADGILNILDVIALVNIVLTN